MKKFVCSVCGYVYEGETAPDFCPICKAPKDKFVEQVGEMKLAAEHEFGIYAKTVKNNPDISAEANLAWRVDCEYGATNGKFELAACAKKNGLDAIHDTVHEMARDEARHGKAFEGLLKRYFG